LLGAGWLKLLPVLGLAFYLSFIPHLHYPYPVHIDEWVLMTLSKTMFAAHSTTFVDPFFGNSVPSITLNSNLESGYQVFLGSIQQVTGVQYETLFRFFPSVISVLGCLSVYALASRYKFGWEAALVTALIPTSVGILGPAFLVPVSLGLVFVPLALLIVFKTNKNNSWATYGTLFVFTTFLLAIHAPSAVLLVLILIPYILLNLRKNFKHSAGISVALALPFLAIFPGIYSLLVPTFKSLFHQISTVNIEGWTSYTYLPQVIVSYGYIPVILCLIGVSVLAAKTDRESRGMVLGLLAVLAMLSMFFTLRYGVWIVYLRGLLFAQLMIGIVAGAGLMAIKKWRLPAKIGTRTVPTAGRYAGYAACAVVVVLALAFAIPARQHASYYQVIDQNDHQAFTWIQDNVPAGYSRAILDPWKATAFTAVTGRNIYTKIHANIAETDLQADAFLANGCSDTAFLKANGISLVYSTGQVQNPDLIEVRTNVYLLEGGG
jgi:hypothetical protein